MITKRADVDWPTVANMFAGGALTGAGVGATTSFLRYLQSLQEQAAKAQDTSYDDDVLYLNLPRHRGSTAPGYPRIKQAFVGGDPSNSAATFAMSGLGGLLGGYLSYNLIRNRYHKMRQKQLQKELDQAQNLYLGGLNTHAEFGKSAGQFSGVSKVFGAGYLATLLTALGSAVIANRILQKQFPAIKSPNRDKPRKIVVRSVGSPGQEVIDGPVSPDAVENLARMNMATKTASTLDFRNVVAAAAQGRVEEIKDLAGYGLDCLFDGVKGASERKSSAFRRNLAVNWVVADSQMRTALAPTLASNIHDMSPDFYWKAAKVPDSFKESLVGLAVSGTRQARKETYRSVLGGLKSASSISGVPAVDSMLLAHALQSMLGSEDNEQQPGTEEDPNSRNLSGVPTSQDSPDMLGKNGADLEAEDEYARDFLSQNGDLIDQAMSKVAPHLNAVHQ